MELSELLTHFGIYAVASSTSSQTKNATTTSNTAATATIESRPVESRPVERFFSPNDCANRGGYATAGIGQNLVIFGYWVEIRRSAFPGMIVQSSLLATYTLPTTSVRRPVMTDNLLLFYDPDTRQSLAALDWS